MKNVADNETVVAFVRISLRKCEEPLGFILKPWPLCVKILVDVKEPSDGQNDLHSPTLMCHSQSQLLCDVNSD